MAADSTPGADDTLAAAPIDANATLDAAAAATQGAVQVHDHSPTRLENLSSDADVATVVRDVLRSRQSDQAPHSEQRYREVRELGRGGMGRVAEVRDAWLGRRIARKTLTHNDAQVRTRFNLEALVTAQLDHPGVPTVYELHTDGQGTPSYTMQLVEGKPLSTLLKGCSDFSARLRLVPVVARVAQTLAFAHERGVVHRDIKPDNVIVGSHGEVVLLDWGIAKVRGLSEAPVSDAAQAGIFPADSDIGLTAHGSVLGTPAYMAPEQARGEVGSIDERTDVFALGAMLFHVLSGRAPYQGSSVTEVLALARAGQAPDIDDVARQAAEGLRAVVRKAMQPEAGQRHASAAEFATDLENFLSAVMAQQPARGVERFANASGAFGLVSAILIGALTWGATPTFREMGAGALLTTIFFAVGLLLAIVEWQTRGRHHLMPLGLAAAATTLVCSLGGATIGLLNVYKAMGQPEALANIQKFNAFDAIGHREALGNIPLGLAMTLMQVAVLALAAYRSHHKAQRT